MSNYFASFQNYQNKNLPILALSIFHSSFILFNTVHSTLTAQFDMKH